MRTQRTSRTGFTITEMMVAMALILFIMAIISTVFSSASQTFRALKAAGDNQEKLRAVTIVLRQDLATAHFDGSDRVGRNGPRLGDQRLDQAGWRPPKSGYFEIRQFGPSVPEPQFGPNGVVPDGEGLFSTRATDHVLRFTNKSSGLSPNELYCTEWVTVGGFTDPLNNRLINSFPPFPATTQGVIYSPWAEIQYFLVPNGDTTALNAAGATLPLNSLHRRVRVLAPEGRDYLVADMNQAQAIIVSNPGIGLAVTGPGPVAPAVLLRVLGPEDVTNPALRMPYQSPMIKPGVGVSGDDILQTDILSFNVKVAWFNNPNFGNNASPASRPTFFPGITTTVNSDAPWDDLPPITAIQGQALNPTLAGQRRFDTWFRHPFADTMDWDRPQPSSGGPGFLSPSPVQPPMRINVRSIQIHIRVWDAKSEMSRQVTLVQEM